MPQTPTVSSSSSVSSDDELIICQADGLKPTVTQRRAGTHMHMYKAGRELHQSHDNDCLSALASPQSNSNAKSPAVEKGGSYRAREKACTTHREWF